MFKASAPGSLMLLGEYAVLENHPALVFAVDKRITVTLIPREDDIVSIQSALGFYNSKLNDIKVEAPFQFVLASILIYQSQMTAGFDIQIVSEFSHTLGFGSSAAVTVATLSVLSTWLKHPLTELELIRAAREIIRQQQGMGSGADVAASVLGGCVYYQAEPLFVETQMFDYPLSVIYSGYKTPTPQVVEKVRQQFVDFPLLYKNICAAIGECAKQGYSAITVKDWVSLGKIMDIQQGLMVSLGVSPPNLQNIVYTLKECKQILGSKLSGSGLGDCIIGLGEYSGAMENILIKNALKGVICE